MIARTQLLIVSETKRSAASRTWWRSAAQQYWDAIQARDNIKVQQQADDLAQKSYERDKLALDLGALPEPRHFPIAIAGGTAQSRA